ncbi:glycosyltransferase family 2 protein [Hymenobacter psychrotolerans]|uniref:Glycosyl transferase family 2 n=1 Tax=Hymenobacter psychrotolerans DSM 18569 TaxID=1121959 RepID=A0A1M6UKC7_9BACT|nr:glycosyltransferase [Hymenobacter psychrotolerans]SHK69603.1 Glycosyl transferase family 2 [Hymenobacter psychrotolerans DSM 18569]
MHFSIITPTHNRRQFLPETIASVRATVSAPLDFGYEHFICENASTDDTASWLKEAAAQDGSPVRVVPQATKLLPGPARNLLIRQTTADSWIVPLDDDDLLLQRCLYHYAGLVQKSPGQQWFVADFLRVDEEKRYLPGEDYYAWRFETPTDMLRAIFRAEHFIQGNVCYRRSLFDEVGGYNETLKMAEDLDLYVRFLLAGHLPVVSPHISHLHRFHSSNVSIGVDAGKHGADLQEIYDQYAEQLQALGIERPG